MNPMHELSAGLDDEQEMIRDTAKKFAEHMLLPGVQERDAEMNFDKSQFEALAELGFSGLTIREDSGGAGLDTATAALAYEELAAAGASLAASLAVHLDGAGRVLDHASSDAHASTLEALVSGEKIASFVGDGCDFAPVDGKVSGRSAPMPGVGVADVFVVRVVDADSVALYCVPKDAPGLQVEALTAPLGLRNAALGRVVLDGFEPSGEMRIAEGSEAQELSENAIAAMRLAFGAIQLGMAKSALARALRYSQERMAFGKSLSKQQAVALKLGKLAESATGASLLVAGAARAASTSPVPASCAFAKNVASELAVRSADEAIQIHGGYGFVTEYDVERLYRDAKVCSVLLGSGDRTRIEVAQRMLAASTPA